MRDHSWQRAAGGRQQDAGADQPAFGCLLPAASRQLFRRRGRTYAGVIIYLVGFAVLLVIVWHSYLAAAIEAAKHADIRGKKYLQAVAQLMLSVVLVYLLAGLILVFRLGRFFFPRPGAGPKRSRTTYVDAWSEAGKRMDEKKAEE